MPVPYYHVVFTLPAAIGAIAFHNKAAVYDLLFRSAAETLITIAADPKHLGARISKQAVAVVCKLIQANSGCLFCRCADSRRDAMGETRKLAADGRSPRPALLLSTNNAGVPP